MIAVLRKASSYYCRKKMSFFLRQKEGLASVEFALILPFFVLLTFGSIEAADALLVKRKVILASNTLADLVAQSDDVTPSEVHDLMNAATQVVAPADTTGLQFQVTSVQRDPSDTDEIIIHWQMDENGFVASAMGADYDQLDNENILNDRTALIVTRVVYPHASPISSAIRAQLVGGIGNGGGKKAISSSRTHVHTSTRWPRLGDKVQICNESRTLCTT